MARYRTYSIEFKRQIVQEYLAGEDSLQGLSRRHGVGRTLIRIWIKKYQDGEFNDEVAVADSLDEYEARIAALERKVGQLTMENDLLKKTLPRARSLNGEIFSIVSGPPASVPGRQDAAS
jgi:transposase